VSGGVVWDTIPMHITEFYAKDRAAWRKWLEQNHEKEQAVWLIYDKGKNRVLSWEDIVQEALCFGWIDSRPGKVSDSQSKLYISKRKKKSVWSKINKAHVEKLLSLGLITPAGLQVIEQAKKDGSWDALNKSDNLELPSELIKQLAAHPSAQTTFSGFTDSAKRMILEWIYAAKTDETRTKRISETVKAATLGKRVK